MEVRLVALKLHIAASHLLAVAYAVVAAAAGAVVLNKVGTFNTYELQIMVSYRKDRLAPLSGTSHRCVGIVIPKAA